MDADNKAIRKALYPGLAFLGDADWAVDLQSENGDGSSNNSSSGGNMYVDPNIWASTTQAITALPGMTLIWPPMPLTTPTVIEFPLWTTFVTYSSLTTRTTTRSDGSTSTYPCYIYVSWLTVLTIPPGKRSSPYSTSDSTTVVGGQAFPPKIITVTPNPHPTTVVSIKDPVINPHPTPPKWTSGKPPRPSSSPGCKGCGLPCILFCNPDCPFCPPGVFPNGDPNNQHPSSSESTSRPSTTTVGHTVFFDMLLDDVFPTGFAALSDLDVSLISSMFHESTSTTRPTEAPTTTAPPPPPAPSADCVFWDEGWGWTFGVFNIDGWSTDGGSSLKKEESGRGALTGWEWHEATSTSFAYAYFNLPYFMKAGCVERAIASAGGPKISCAGQGLGVDGKRNGVASKFTSLTVRAQRKAKAVPPVFSKEQQEEFKNFYAVNSTYQTYLPQSWSSNLATSTEATTSAS